MKTQNIKIKPLIELRTQVGDQNFYRKIYEYELMADDMRTGKTIKVVLPYWMDEEIPEVEEVLEYIGSTEEAIVIQKNTYLTTEEGEISNSEIIVLEFES